MKLLYRIVGIVSILFGIAGIIVFTPFAAMIFDPVQTEPSKYLVGVAVFLLFEAAFFAAIVLGWRCAWKLPKQ